MIRNVKKTHILISETILKHFNIWQGKNLKKIFFSKDLQCVIRIHNFLRLTTAKEGDPSLIGQIVLLVNI